MGRSQGIELDRECFQGVERIFNFKHITRPIHSELLVLYIQLLKEFSNDIMFAMIALRESNPSNFKALKVELQNE